MAWRDLGAALDGLAGRGRLVEVSKVSFPAGAAARAQAALRALEPAAGAVATAAGPSDRRWAGL